MWLSRKKIYFPASLITGLIQMTKLLSRWYMQKFVKTVLKRSWGKKFLWFCCFDSKCDAWSFGSCFGPGGRKHELKMTERQGKRLVHWFCGVIYQPWTTYFLTCFTWEKEKTTLFCLNQYYFISSNSAKLNTWYILRIKLSIFSHFALFWCLFLFYSAWHPH